MCAFDMLLVKATCLLAYNQDDSNFMISLLR